MTLEGEILPQIAVKPLLWGDVEQKAFCYVYGFLTSVPVYEQEGNLVLLLDAEARARHLAEALTVIHFRGEVLEGVWRFNVIEASVWGAIGYRFAEFTRIRETWSWALAIIPRFVDFAVRGVVNATSTIHKIDKEEYLTFYTLEKDMAERVDRTLTDYGIDFRRYEDEVYLPARIDVDEAIRAEGKDVVTAYYFALDSQNMRKLQIMIGILVPEGGVGR